MKAPGSEGRARGETQGGSSGSWASNRAGQHPAHTQSALQLFLSLSFRLSAVGFGPGGLILRSWGPCLELLQPPGSSACPRSYHSPPSAVPSTLSSPLPPLFRVSAGGRGGQEQVLPYYFLLQVLFHSRAWALTLNPKSAPTHSAQCLCSSGGSAHRGMCSSRELST